MPSCLNKYYLILLSQKSISSAPNIDVDCIPALKLPKIKIYGVLAESIMHCKLMEMYILEESSGHIFSDSQFGFVSGRGTEIATALVNDVISYANVRGSTVYTCSFDAEGAFDAIPHCVLFKNASEVLPDYCWHVMVNWYEKLTVQIKWCKQLSVKISVYIEGLELKRTISTFFKKWAKCTFLVLSNHTLHVRSHCILYLVKDA